jgi:RNA polymerase sigma-70 factor (ECF subfamily)
MRAPRVVRLIRRRMTPLDDYSERISDSAMQSLLQNRSQFLSFIERRVGSRELAEELLQEAYVRGIERGGALQADESARAWFYRLLKNAIVDRHRRSAASGRALEAWATELETAGDPNSVVHDAVCRCVSGLVDTLKPEYQAPLRAIDLDGRELRDFAQESGISPNNAAVRLHRAREALGERVRAMCGACATHGCMNCTCDR